MNVRTRALRDEDKQARRQEILDAAERLFGARPEGLASVDELAEAAGIAKGTVYLYFPSKEEVLVALHERQITAFFDALDAGLAQGPQFALEEMLALTRREMLDHPHRLSLAAIAVALTERTVPAEAALRFKMAVGARLIAAGNEFESRFGLAPGEGTWLLNASYALILGMWQLKGCMGAARYEHLLDPAIGRAFVTAYPEETLAALRTLWTSAIADAQRGLTTPRRWHGHLPPDEQAP